MSRASEILLENADSITLNCSDFFMWAYADSMEINDEELEWVIPTIEKFPDMEKYGCAGLNACMAYIENCAPLRPYYHTPKFTEAIEYLKELNPKIETRDYHLKDQNAYRVRADSVIEPLTPKP